VIEEKTTTSPKCNVQRYDDDYKTITFNEDEFNLVSEMLESYIPNDPSISFGIVLDGVKEKFGVSEDA
jgi:hypothetical protein